MNNVVINELNRNEGYRRSRPCNLVSLPNKLLLKNPGPELLKTSKKSAARRGSHTAFNELNVARLRTSDSTVLFKLV